ncbi:MULTISPECIES: DUF6188 family protein [unclassified Streptomyces]|uniref:DUF6188 family protein n=1 Tax=unclassified Streptomyces TaxID=2593676 RepID=UPI003866A69B
MALDCPISQGAVVSAERTPVEHEDRWALPLRGMKLTEITVDFRLVLVLDSDGAVALEAPVDLSHRTPHANPSVLLKPESQDVAAALALFGAKVLSAVADRAVRASVSANLVALSGHRFTPRTLTALRAVPTVSWPTSVERMEWPLCRIWIHLPLAPSRGADLLSPGHARQVPGRSRRSLCRGRGARIPVHLPRFPPALRGA